MDDATWNKCERLYERARAGDDEAWLELEQAVVRPLCAGLRERLRPWEIEELAHDAFEAMTLRMKRIPSWPQAWRYACKALKSLAIDRSRGDRFACGRLSEEGPAADTRSLRFMERIELQDRLQALSEALSEVDRAVVLAMLDLILEGKALTLPALAAKLDVSMSTAKRRLQDVRIFSRRFLQDR